MREQSLSYHGGRLFNSLPVELRNCSESTEVFKRKLDEVLSNIPDQPVSPGLLPEVRNQFNGKYSNSIVDWCRHLNISKRRPQLVN